jgi:hypothetical protein
MALSVTCAFASSFTSTINQVDSTSGHPVDVSATMTLQSGSAVIQLSDLEMNPIADSQNLSGFFFTLDNIYSGLTLTSATGDLVTISSNGQVTDLGTGNLSAWSLSTTTSNGKSVVKLTMIGTAHAPQTIIGPANSSTNTYSAANPSIAGSVHNPFVLGNATFVVSASGITADTVIDAATFGFSTSAGDMIVAQINADQVNTGSNNGAIPATPEPSTAWLFLSGTGLIVIFLARSRFGAFR